MEEIKDSRIGFRQVSTYRPSLPQKQSCLDISGERKADGRYYTPVNKLCTLCLCANGKPDGCITLRCKTPQCDDFEEVSGTCCRYRCPGEYAMTDNTTLAVVISLVVVLLLTLAAIVFIVRKMKRSRNRYNDTVVRPPTGMAGGGCHVSGNPSMLLNSIPNNLRPPHTSTPIPPITIGGSRCHQKNKKLNNFELRTPHKTACHRNESSDDESLGLVMGKRSNERLGHPGVNVESVECLNDSGNGSNADVTTTTTLTKNGTSSPDRKMSLEQELSMEECIPPPYSSSVRNEE